MSENLQLIDRTLDVLETVATDAMGLGVTEIATILKLPKSTVFRILQSLTNRNYLQKSETTEKYSLAHKFLAISSQYYSGLDIRIVASPYVRELSSKTNATVHIAIRSGNDAIYIEKFKPFAYSCSYSEIGKSIPLYCSSIGKILLSGLSDKELETYFEDLQIYRFTKNTLQLDELKKQISHAKILNFAIDDAEHEEDSFCLGTSIKNFQKNIIAAISISSNNRELMFQERYQHELIDCANKISKIFGYESEEKR